jgi:AmiR/NasT family two-component response regulator
MRRLRIPDLGGARAIILHRPHATVQTIDRQLSAIGLSCEAHWPDLTPEVFGADFVFFDTDMGHDEQFPWTRGQSPMPMIALIGSEAPGRIEWALGMGADAQILKPVGDSGVYSALLIARAGFEARRALAAEIETLQRRLSERQTVVRAVTILSVGRGDDAAYAELRRLAMSWRVNIEEAAARVVARGEGRNVRHRSS